MVDFPEAEVMAIIAEEAQRAQETGLWTIPHARHHIHKLLIDRVIQPEENPDTPIELLHRIFDARLALAHLCTMQKITFVFQGDDLKHLEAIHAQVRQVVIDMRAAQWLGWAQDTEVPHELGEAVLSIENDTMADEATRLAARTANMEARVPATRFVAMDEMMTFCQYLLMTIQQSEDFDTLYKQGMELLQEARPLFEASTPRSTN